MIDYEEDAHFCIKCHVTIIGLDNYINHRKVGCCKNITEAPKSPLPSQLLSSDESFNLKADDFFTSLELRSSSKKSEVQSTSGKNFSGILTRSKTTAVIQASSSHAFKEPLEPQQSKSGKNVWIGGHQLKELGHGDNQSKLIKAVDNLERRKDEPPKLEDVYEDSDEDSEEYDYDVEDTSSDDQDGPPRHHTGGKWKPSSPIQWTRSTETRDWNFPPPTFTGGKWKPKRSTSPRATHTKGKWKPSFTHKEDYNDPPPTFTGSKWVASKRQEQDVPLPTHTKGKWKPRGEEEQYSSGGKGKWKPVENVEDDNPPANYTKGKWKPKSPLGIDISQPTISKTEKPEENYTKGKWIPPEGTETKPFKKISDNSLLRKSSGTVQYWCSPCNRRLASKIVYERHLKSELHFKRTSRDREFDETDELSLINEARRTILIPPEHIFSNQDAGSGNKKKRNRKKRYEKCDVCYSKVQKYMIGKHLISHYHCRKGDIKSEVAKRMVLENIHGIVLESPFQCSICKFYCNTQQDFLRHWLSPQHVNRQAPGYFFCILCKYRSSDTQLMYKHLQSSEHLEVISVINRSVPIVIKKINPLHCLTCGQEFLMNVQLINHCRKFNHDDSLAKKARNSYICELCNMGLLSNEALRRHKRLVHNEKYYVCSTCNLKFEDITEAKLHRTKQEHRYASLKKKNTDGSLAKSCEYCGVRFGNFLLLKQHLKSAHPQHNIRCPHCGANFTIAQELTTHLRLKLCKFEEIPQSSENTLQCERCPFFSNTLSELIFHMALHEEPLVQYQDQSSGKKMKTIFKYKCPVCEKFFPKNSLHAHIRQHTEEKPFVCNICGKCFARKNNLHVHVNNHKKKEERTELTEKTFLCYMCGANFKKKSILQQHMQIHTGKLCKCPYVGCIYTARKMSEIKEHFKIHLNEKNFSCNICDYKGKTKSHLTRHMTIHKDIKKYNCPQCSFTSRDSQHLRRHLRIHTGAKPYSCPHCSYKCSNLENLRKHVLSTNKHVGKFLYECRFCTNELPKSFQSNFARDFKVHLVTCHQDMFSNGTDAASYVTGIYDVQDDSTQVHNNQSEKVNLVESPISVENSDDDPIVCQPDVASTSKDRSIIENPPDSWSLVGRYDVEEASGTLIPFESDSESLFQEHF